MKLTQKEAELVLNEAYRLKEKHKESYSRLGQSIWWCHELYEESMLTLNLAVKLGQMMYDLKEKGSDFYYWTEDSEVIKTFYEHFVEGV